MEQSQSVFSLYDTGSGKTLADAAILYMPDRLSAADTHILINMLKDQIKKGKRR